MTYSFVITSDSAWVTRLQLWPALSSALLIRMKPAPSRFGILDARSRTGAVRRVAARAVGDHQPVVELLLRRPRLPLLARLEQRRDGVLVAVDVAGLLADDERHLLAGLRLGGRDRRGRRRVLRVVGLQDVRARDAGHADADSRGAYRGVQELSLRRLVTLAVLRAGLALPRLDLRAGEHRTAKRMVGDSQPGALAVRRRDEPVGAELEPRHQALDVVIGPAGEPMRDVRAVQPHPQPADLRAVRQNDAGEDITAGDQIRAVGQRLDRQGLRRLVMRPRGSTDNGVAGRGARADRPARVRRRRQGAHQEQQWYAVQHWTTDSSSAQRNAPHRTKVCADFDPMRRSPPTRSR